MRFNIYITLPHIRNTTLLHFSFNIVLSQLLLNQRPVGGSISPCYRAIMHTVDSETETSFCVEQRFQPVFFCVILALHIIFSALICSDKSPVLYYILINWNVTILTENVREVVRRESRRGIWFCSKQSSISSQVASSVFQP